MAYLDAGECAGLGSENMERVKWEGGKAGDFNAQGVPYGTPVYLVPQYEAIALADREKVAADTAPWANLFGSAKTNPLGLSTPELAAVGIAGIIGLVVLKKFIKRKKAKK